MCIFVIRCRVHLLIFLVSCRTFSLSLSLSLLSLSLSEGSAVSLWLSLSLCCLSLWTPLVRARFAVSSTFGIGGFVSWCSRVADEISVSRGPFRISLSWSSDPTLGAQQEPSQNGRFPPPRTGPFWPPPTAPRNLGRLALSM